MFIRSIGVLDSGIGGLTVAREIIRLLPNENLVYIGDRVNAPYGKKSKQEIFDLSVKLVDFLISKNAKAIVVACNTITVSCLDDLRKKYPEIPIIGTVPVVKTAASLSRSRRIGVLSTTGTAQSRYQKNLIEKFAPGCFVVNSGTDKLVPLIEKGAVGGEEFTSLLDSELKIFVENKIDVLALGCTHFPLIKDKIRRFLGNNVAVLDSGEAIARQVGRVLEANNDLYDLGEGRCKYYFTGNSELPIKLINSYFDGKFSGEVNYVDKS